MYNAPRLHEHLAAVTRSGAKEVVLDLARVDLVDSTGLGVIVGALKRLHAQGGNLTLTGVPAPTFKVLELMGLTHFLNIDLTERPQDVTAAGGEGRR